VTSPCTPENIKAYKFYHTYSADKTKWVFLFPGDILAHINRIMSLHFSSGILGTQLWHDLKKTLNTIKVLSYNGEEWSFSWELYWMTPLWTTCPEEPLNGFKYKYTYI
jgi:hypothetical protein